MCPKLAATLLLLGLALCSLRLTSALEVEPWKPAHLFKYAGPILSKREVPGTEPSPPMAWVYCLMEFPIQYKPGRWVKVNTSAPFLIAYNNSVLKSMESDPFNERYAWDGEEQAFYPRNSHHVLLRKPETEGKHKLCTLFLAIGDEQAALDACDFQQAEEGPLVVDLGQHRFAVYLTKPTWVIESTPYKRNYPKYLPEGAHLVRVGAGNFLAVGPLPCIDGPRDTLMIIRESHLAVQATGKSEMKQPSPGSQGFDDLMQLLKNFKPYRVLSFRDAKRWYEAKKEECGKQ